MPSPHVAVVILNWNGRNFLERFLPSVLAATYPNFEVVVGDNASTDDSLAFLRTHYPAIRLITMDKNLGFAGGYNGTLRHVEADYYVLLNSDAEVAPGWLEPMVELLESDSRIAACQPKLLYHHDPSLFEYSGAAGGWIDRLGYPFARGRVFHVCEQDKGQYETTEPIFWASGAALFIRAAVYREMKGFDAFFFAHQEEIDLCWRIQLAGYRIFACPRAVVYHVGGGTLPKENPRKTFLNFRNNRIMLSKNLPWQRKLWVIPVRLVLDLVSAFKSLLGGKPGYCWAVIRAHGAFVGWWLFHRRESVFPANRRGKLEGVSASNIAWQFFVRGKKTFAEIVDKTA